MNTMMADINEQVIENMLRTLVELYVKDDSYPKTFDGFWDVPQPKYASVITSKDELLGRIKQLGQLVNAKEVEVSVGQTKVVMTI